jgi:hypothetical protein
MSFFLFPPLEAAVRALIMRMVSLFFSVYHSEQALAIRETYGHPPLFIFRMVGIGNGDRQRISENSGGLSKIDSVFLRFCRALRLSHSNLIGIQRLSRSAV